MATSDATSWPAFRRTDSDIFEYTLNQELSVLLQKIKEKAPVASGGDIQSHGLTVRHRPRIASSGK